MARPLTMRSETPEYQDVYGDEPTVVWYHWHEMFHYYLGAKYFAELGYTGLYPAALLADSEQENQIFLKTGARRLSNIMYWDNYPTVMQWARRDYRPRFTSQRWQEFKDDLQAMKNLVTPEYADEALWDAGYNPPPTWSVFGVTVANLVPIQESQSWLGNLRPYWYQALWPPMVDVLMISVAFAFIIWSFGPVPAMGFIFMYCASWIANYNWTSGSFFRWTWISELMVATALLNKKRYAAGGAFMALSTLDRIFPAAFAIGASLPLLYRACRNRDRAPLLRYIAGGALAGAILLAISIAMFGLTVWGEFFERIFILKNSIFLESIGYQRIAEYLAGNFSGPGPGMDNFRLWNDQLHAAWASTALYHYPVIALLLLASLVAATGISAAESAFLFGGILFFTIQVATGYYYIYLPLIVVVVSASPRTRVRDTVIALCFAYQFWTWADQLFWFEKTQLNFYNNLGLLVLYGYWAIGRAGECIRSGSITRAAGLTHRTAGPPL